MKFELDEHKRNIPNDVLIDDLKYVAKKLNQNKLTTAAYKSNGGKYSLDTYSKRFGSWFKCLKLAGLKATRSPLNISVEDLFKNLADVWTVLGRQPKYNEMIKPVSIYSSGTYERRFGTWRKALEAFVRWANEEKIQPDIPVKMTHKKKHRTPRTINYRLRFLVMRRDNFKCRITGRSPATNPNVILEVDHIVPWDKDGETVMENLQTLAKEINIGKSNLDMYEIS